MSTSICLLYHLLAKRKQKHLSGLAIQGMHLLRGVSSIHIHITMTNLELVVLQIATEIRVENDGRSFATIRGTSRLIGRDNRNLSRDLLTAASCRKAKLAEYLIELGFEGAAISTWGQTGIPDMAVHAIATYYAYKCDERYRTIEAERCALVFGSVGVRKLFQEAVGWHSQTQEASANPISNEELFKAFTDLASQVKQILPMAEKQRNLEIVTEAKYPQLGKLAAMLSDKKAQKMLGSNDLYTASEWLEAKNIEADRGTKIAFGILASSTYLAMTGKRPERIQVSANTFGARAYRPMDFNFLEIAWESREMELGAE